jgi:hypothetical protein
MLRDNITRSQKIVDGITYSYDSTREKWLSIGRCHVIYSINHKNINTSRWLAVSNGIYSNNIGFKVQGKGTITGATLQAKDITTCKFMIKDDDLLVTVELNDEENKIINLNSDFEETASLKCYLEIDNNTISYPFVCLECASKL